MLRRSLLLFAGLLALAALSTADSQVVNRTASTCAAPDVTLSHRTVLADAVQRWKREGGMSRRGGIVQIPVAFHVIAVGDQLSQGAVSEARVTAQINAMNTVVFPLGYRLVRVVTTRTENASWWDLGRETFEEAAMKQALARDPTRYLNIYSTRVADDLLGWAYSPGTFSSDPATDEADVRHGLVVDFRTLPGGAFEQYDTGDTAIHELGHFLGLLHTYEGWTPQAPTGGCAVGDDVEDTPFQASPNLSGCDTSRDTCPGLAGLDPVRNFMGAGADACVDDFTPGQASRMAALFAGFKPSLADGAEIFVPETEVDFGPVAVGGDAEQTVRIVSLRGPLLASAQVTTTGRGFSASPGQVTVQAGSTVDLTVTFSPGVVGSASGTLRIDTGNADLGTLTVPLSGSGILAPSLTADPLAVTASVPVGGSTTVPLTISNAGPGALTYALDTGGGNGPTDSFGYTWIDSDVPAGPQYDWVDIDGGGGGVDLALGDDDSELVQLPFAIDWYGQSYDAVHVASNGFLTFAGPASAFDNTALPAAGEPNALIAPYWDDLTFGPASRVTVRDLGGGRFAAQWTEMDAYENPGTATFQVILRSDGDVLFQYQTVDYDAPSATIGIEDETGTIGLEVSKDLEYARAGLAVRFTTSASWITAATPSVGTVAVGGSETIDVTLDASGLSGGVYQRLLTLSSNDPDRGTLRIPAILAVGGTARPPAPTAPAYGATELPVAVDLEWLPVPEATEYGVQVAADATFATLLGSAAVTDPTWTFDADGSSAYVWRVRARVDGRLSDWSIPFTFATAEPVASERVVAADGLTIGAAYPNPVTERLSLPITLDAPASVTATVFDVTGRRIAVVHDGPLPAGTRTLGWDVGDLPPGAYLVRVRAAEQTDTTRFIVLPSR